MVGSKTLAVAFTRAVPYGETAVVRIVSCFKRRTSLSLGAGETSNSLRRLVSGLWFWKSTFCLFILVRLVPGGCCHSSTLCGLNSNGQLGDVSITNKVISLESRLESTEPHTSFWRSYAFHGYVWNHSHCIILLTNFIRWGWPNPQLPLRTKVTAGQTEIKAMQLITTKWLAVCARCQVTKNAKGATETGELIRLSPELPLMVFINNYTWPSWYCNLSLLWVCVFEDYFLTVGCLLIMSVSYRSWPGFPCVCLLLPMTLFFWGTHSLPFRL